MCSLGMRVTNLTNARCAKAEKIEARGLNLAQIQIVLLETKDKLNRPYNLTLVSDQMMIRLMEVIG